MSDTAYSGARENAQMHPRSHSQELLERMPERIRRIVMEEWDSSSMYLNDLIVRNGLSEACVRHKIWWRIRQTPNALGRSPSYPQIGAWFGRDHSTILCGVQRHIKRMASQ